MGGKVRRCAYILCHQPLPATARSDKRYCCPAHKAVAHRWRHQLQGLLDEHVVHCPVCGTRFALGHGYRREAVYSGHARRQSAYSCDQDWYLAPRWASRPGSARSDDSQVAPAKIDGRPR